MCTAFSDTDMIVETSMEPNDRPDFLMDAFTELHEATRNGLDLLRLENLSLDEPISYEIYWRVQIK